MSDRPSSSPKFTVDGVTFQCWIVDGGHRYEWRSTCGRCRVGRNAGNAMAWSSADGAMLGAHFVGLRLAMQAAVRALARRGRAA